MAGEAHYNVNDLDQEKFVSKSGALHEHSPWITKEACGRIAVATAVSASAWVYQSCRAVARTVCLYGGVLTYFEEETLSWEIARRLGRRGRICQGPRS
jgi:hypothetical protein